MKADYFDGLFSPILAEASPVVPGASPVNGDSEKPVNTRVSPVSPVVPAKKADAVKISGSSRQRQPAKIHTLLGRLLIDVCSELDITPQEIYRALSDDEFKDIADGRMILEDLRVFAHELIQLRSQEPAGGSQGAQYDAAIVQLYDEETERLFNLFMDHLGGEGKATNCCNGPAGRYCEEGQRLKDAYYRKFH